MHRPEDRLIYRNLRFICKSAHLTYKDLAFVLQIPIETLRSMEKRGNRIKERYGDLFEKRLGIFKEDLFDRPLDTNGMGIQMYFSKEHYARILKEFYSFEQPGRSDHQAESLHMLCRIIANSPIRLYIDYHGQIRVDQKSVEENYPLLEQSVSSSLIKVDSSSSVKDYEAPLRALKLKQEAYEKEVELITYLANRANAFFPCFKAGARYKKIFLYNMIYKKSHEQMKESFDYERGYQSFLKDKNVTKEIACKAFGFWGEKRIERFFAHLEVKREGQEVKDQSTKIKLYRRTKGEQL